MTVPSKHSLVNIGGRIMYNLSLERRKDDRRYSKLANKDKNLVNERRLIDRRNDNRPLNEFPYLPQIISY